MNEQGSIANPPAGGTLTSSEWFVTEGNTMGAAERDGSWLLINL
jgi:hypothetical protein